MAATIEQMIQQQMTLIQDLSSALKQYVDDSEYLLDCNGELENKIESLNGEIEDLQERIMILEGQNFKLRKTIWRLKNDFNCTCEEVGRHACEKFK